MKRATCSAIRLVAVGLVALGISSVAQANPIPVFNTGVNGAGTPLADGTIGDPHYALVSDSGNPGTASNQFQLGFASFSVGGGFVQGVNTLDVIVNNQGGPTALRTELSGTANFLAPVPEPASMLLLGTGLFGGAVRRWRKSRASV